MKRIQVVRGGRTARWTVRLSLAAVLIVALLFPFFADPTTNYKYTLVAIWAIAALGLNILTGYSGQISVAQSVFFAAGAYTSAILMTQQGWSYLETLPASLAVSFVLGIIIGMPARRLSGVYLATVTLAAAVVLRPVLERLSFTGGQSGIIVQQPTAPSWSGLAPDQWLYLLALAGLIVALIVARNIRRGALGKVLIAMRDNEIAATAFGVDPAHMKVVAFAVSAAFGGLAGSLYTFTVGLVSPDSFDLLMSIGLLAAIVVGGIGTLSGAVIGAAFVRLMPEYASHVSDSLAGVVYGVTLIGFMLVMPRGLVGLAAWVRDRFVVLVDPEPPVLEGVPEPIATNAMPTDALHPGAAVP